MSKTTGQTSGAELVPIADRLRYMLGFRLVLACAVGFVGYLSRESLETSAAAFATVTGAYVALSLLSYAAFRISRRGGLVLFGFSLMLDGLFLAWTAYATGGAASPLRYLILVHLVAVALLASYRTGMKLAMWHSLLLLVVYYAQDAEILRPLEADGDLGVGTPFEQLLGFSAIFWFVAISTASFSAVNERELRRRRFDLEALSGMATRLEEESDSKSVADTLLDAVVDTFDFEHALLLGARDGERLTLLAGCGDIKETADKPTPPEGSVLARAMETRETQLVSRLDRNVDGWLASLLPGSHNLVVVPLSAEGHSIGVLVARYEFRRGSRIERRVVSMMERFASHGALALRNAWLLEEVQRLAATDGLTGVANRGTFEATLERELSRAGRSGEDVTLVMIDIDHFKRLNDSYGHQTGDEVLRRVAGVLKDGCRAYDTAARYGGEEFAVVLPRTARDDGFAIAERIRQTVAGTLDEPGVTVSAGLATFPLDASDPQALIGAADSALYESKRAGRDRVTVSSRGDAAFAS